MDKRGQFYFVAVLVIVSVFIGFIAVTNQTKVKHNEPFFEAEDELKIERRYLIDYIFYEDLNDVQAGIKFENFSSLYASKFGNDKNSVFIFGDTGSITFNGNHVENTNFSYDCGSGEIDFPSSGSFDRSCTPNSDNVTIYLENQGYEFEIYEGQNLYYLVSYVYDKERFTIYG